MLNHEVVPHVCKVHAIPATNRQFALSEDVVCEAKPRRNVLVVREVPIGSTQSVGAVRKHHTCTALGNSRSRRLGNRECGRLSSDVVERLEVIVAKAKIYCQLARDAIIVLEEFTQLRGPNIEGRPANSKPEAFGKPQHKIGQRVPRESSGKLIECVLNEEKVEVFLNPPELDAEFHGVLPARQRKRVRQLICVLGRDRWALDRIPQTGLT